HFFVLPHLQKIRVEHVSGDRVELKILEQHERLRAPVELELNQRVQLGWRGHRVLDRERVHRDVLGRLQLTAVYHRGNQTLRPEAAGRSLPCAIARLGLQSSSGIHRALLPDAFRLRRGILRWQAPKAMAYAQPAFCQDGRAKVKDKPNSELGESPRGIRAIASPKSRRVHKTRNWGIASASFERGIVSVPVICPSGDS